MERNMHKYEELTPYEFDKEKERASIVYVAAGPLEYHEECNALGTDPCKGYHWCLKAAEITGGIVFPMLPIAPAGGRPFRTREELRERYKMPHFTEYTERVGIYPGIFFSREACRELYLELLEVLAVELKFKLCVFVGSHGPAGWMIKDIVREHMGLDYEADTHSICGEFHGMRVMAVGSTDYNKDVIVDYYNQHGIVGGSKHGGLWESAFNYANHPEYFQPELLDETKYPQHYGALPEYVTEGIIRPVKSEYRAFTPEFAQQLLDVTVTRLSEAVLKNYQEVLEGK